LKKKKKKLGESYFNTRREMQRKPPLRRALLPQGKFPPWETYKKKKRRVGVGTKKKSTSDQPELASQLDKNVILQNETKPDN